MTMPMTMPMTTEPNYPLRRTVAAVLVVAALLVGVLLLGGVVTSFGGRPASAAEARPTTSSGVADAARHVARAGDTMWSIASTYRGSADHDRYLDALLRLNGEASIVVGQAVVLP